MVEIPWPLILETPALRFLAQMLAGAILCTSCIVVVRLAILASEKLAVDAWRVQRRFGAHLRMRRRENVAPRPPHSMIEVKR